MEPICIPDESRRLLTHGSKQGTTSGQLNTNTAGTVQALIHRDRQDRRSPVGPILQDEW
jgi:hypothetical protein